ncbi:hypothetical protein [Sphingomonas sp. LK11]|uniref:hypothetical protein n=1 Tax=Sphingomonas sp. LK11 TaxID=1390395 RepID=UPI001C12B96B|nr:hypothetical protein [Sphingomonas sp. LK11]
MNDMTQATGDRRKVAIFVERFLPPSQAFVLAQARGYERYAPRFLVGKRIDQGHGGQTDLPVHAIDASPAMKGGRCCSRSRASRPPPSSRRWPGPT